MDGSFCIDYITIRSLMKIRSSMKNSCSSAQAFRRCNTKDGMCEKIRQIVYYLMYLDKAGLCVLLRFIFTIIGFFVHEGGGRLFTAHRYTLSIGAAEGLDYSLHLDCQPKNRLGY